MVRNTLSVLAALALVALICIGGWQLGWWMQSAATNRSAHIYFNSYGSQSAVIDTLSQKISNINAMRTDGTPAGVRRGYIDDACQTADRLSPTTLSEISPRLISFIDSECN